MRSSSSRIAVQATPARVNVVAVGPPPTVTSSNSIVTVPLLLETVVSFAVAEIARTAPLALCPRFTAEETEKSSESKMQYLY